MAIFTDIDYKENIKSRINWNNTIETTGNFPRNASVIGKYKRWSKDYMLVKIIGRDRDHPEGEYLVNIDTGYVRGSLFIRNKD